MAVCRILLGCAFVMDALEASGILLRIEQGRLAVPGPLPLPITDTTIQAWTLLSVIAGAMVFAGVVTEAAAAAAAALAVLALAWDQQVYSSHLWLTTLLLTYLVFSKSDSRWSVRAALLGRRDAVPAWPALLMVTQLSVCYFFAGLSKLNPWWLAGDELRPTVRLDLPGAGFTVLAALVIATEVFIATGMWFRRTRLLAIGTGVLLHASIVALMYKPLTLVAFTFACLAVYPLMVSAPFVRSRDRDARRAADARDAVLR
ncbi:hypothetical protein CF8_2756 [Nocardioides sp. CF8]|nr:hypothetical protein CF8_2756 [Nocardioides sp. CF8]